MNSLILNTTFTKKHVLYLMIFVVPTLLSCHRQQIVTDYYYKGFPQNPKVINEGLKLNPDQSFKYSGIIYEGGPYASNFEFLGVYRINNRSISFKLDTIKSFTHIVQEEGEKNADHKTYAARFKERNQFRKGKFHLKPKYSINESKFIILDQTHERFVKLDLK